MYWGSNTCWMFGKDFGQGGGAIATNASGAIATNAACRLPGMRGCLTSFRGYAGVEDTLSATSNVASAADCAEQCRQDPACKSTYWGPTSPLRGVVCPRGVA